MSPAAFDAVTGAFGYIGRAVAQALLAEGRAVVTFTRRDAGGDPLAARVRSLPQRFDDRAWLAERLRGCEVLYNTYWIRFERHGASFDRAVGRSAHLFEAAREAGVRRIVHVSVTNCREDSPLPYYAGKARVERTLRATGISHAIVRPTLVFGRRDVLVNNIAWCLRRFPFFAIPGHGRYRLQPVHVRDLAGLLVQAGASTTDETFDAAGPDTLNYCDLVLLLRRRLGLRTRVVRLPAGLALGLGRLVGLFVRDVLLTHDELQGLRGELLVSREPPRGVTRLADWLAGVAGELGTRYASEYERHFRGMPPG